jgi:hypothetical protein
MDYLVTGVQFIVKARAGFYVLGHRGFGFERREADLPPIGEAGKGDRPVSGGGRRRRLGAAQHEVEHLFLVVDEVVHSVVDAEERFAVDDMGPQQATGLQEVEQDAPARDLRVAVAVFVNVNRCSEI